MQNITGVVYEVLEKELVILSEKGEFEFVKRKTDAVVGQVIEYSENDVRSHLHNYRIYSYIVAGIAAVFAIAFIFYRILPFTLTDGIYGYIDIDINPSVELVFDNEYKVVDVKPMNQDAEWVVKEIEVKNESVENAVEEVIDQSQKSGFIKPQGRNAVLISAAFNAGNNHEEKKLDGLLSEIDQRIKKRVNLESKIIRLLPNERREAQKNHLSMGRYYLLSKAQDKGILLTLEEVRDTKIVELFKKVFSDDPKESLAPSEELTSAAVPERSNETKPINPTPAITQVKAPTLTSVKPVATMIPVEPMRTVMETKSPVQVSAVTPTPAAYISITPKVSEPIITLQPVKNGSLKIQFYSSDRTPTVQGSHFDFKIVNTGPTVISLKDVKVRYYLSDSENIAFNCSLYFYSLGNKNQVYGMFHDLKDSEKANKYLELKFYSGKIKPGEAAFVMGEITKKNWGKFSQSDDYSFDSKDVAYVDWNKVTGYISNELVWGLEP